MLPRITAILIGYACGLFQTAYIYGKAHGIDIRTVGSGNAGTTNTLRTFGKKAGYLVFAGDFLKSLVAVLIVWALFHKSYGDIMPTLNLYAGLGAMMGHNYPFYMHFKGGKGVACLAGAAFAYSRPMFFVGLVLFILAILFTHYVSLGSLLIALTLFFGTLIGSVTGCFHMSFPHLVELNIVAAIMAGQVFFTHRSNIKRLISGTERKTYVLSSKRKNS